MTLWSVSGPPPSSHPHQTFQAEARPRTLSKIVAILPSVHELRWLEKVALPWDWAGGRRGLERYDGVLGDHRTGGGRRNRMS